MSTPIVTDLSSTTSTQSVPATTVTQLAPSAAPVVYPQATPAPVAGNVPPSAASIIAMAQRVGANLPPVQTATESAVQHGTSIVPTAISQAQSFGAVSSTAQAAGMGAVEALTSSSLDIASSTAAVASQPVGITTSQQTPVTMLYQSLIATQTAVTAVTTSAAVMNSTAIPVAISGQPVVSQGNVSMVAAAVTSSQSGKEMAETVSRQTEEIAEGDIPYDPADALDLELESKTNEGESVRSGLAGERKNEKEGERNVEKENEKSKKTVDGDEPYDPEDDFVLDLIEDLSMPSSLKKIEKPNVSSFDFAIFLLGFPTSLTKSLFFHARCSLQSFQISGIWRT